MVRNVGRDGLVRPLQPVGLHDVALDQLANTYERDRAPKGVLTGHPLFGANDNGVCQFNAGQITTVNACAFVFTRLVLPQVKRTCFSNSGSPGDVPARDVPARPVVRLGPFLKGAVLEEELPSLHHRYFRRWDRKNLVCELESLLVRPKPPVVTDFRQ
jgi:hypothetical protein